MASRSSLFVFAVLAGLAGCQATPPSAGTSSPLLSCFTPAGSPADANVLGVAASGDRALAATSVGLFERTASGWRRMPDVPFGKDGLLGLALRGDDTFVATRDGVYHAGATRSWKLWAHPLFGNSQIFTTSGDRVAAALDGLPFVFDPWSETWSAIDVTASGGSCSGIIGLAYADTALYAANFSDGLLVQESPGAAWTSIAVPHDPSSFAACTAVASAPTTQRALGGRRLFAVCGGRLYRRDPSGAWTALAQLDESADQLVVDGDTLFVRTFGQFLRSTDGGVTFAAVASSAAAMGIGSGLATSNDATYVVGYGEILRSNAGGAFVAEPIVAANVLRLAYGEHAGLLAQTDVSLTYHQSTDGGASFAKLTGRAQAVIAGGDLFARSASGTLFDETTQQGLVLPDVLRDSPTNAVLSGSSQALFVSDGYSSKSCLIGGVYRSSRSRGFFRSVDGGQTWQDATAGLVPDAAACPDAAYPVIDEVRDAGEGALFARTGAFAYFSTDGGLSWKPLPQLGDQAWTTGLALVGAKLYASTNQGLFASLDRGASFAAVPAFTARPISAMVTDGTRLLLALSGATGDKDHFGVWSSEDAGETFHLVDSDLRAHVTALALSPTHVYAAVEGDGVYRAALSRCER